MKKLCLLFIILLSFLKLNAQEFVKKTFQNYTNTAIVKVDTDINQDGYIDHIVLNQVNSQIIFYNNIGGLYHEQTIVFENELNEFSFKDLRVADLNNDGVKEIVASSPQLKMLIIYNLSPSGVLIEKKRVTSISAINNFDFVDIDKNGFLDVVYWVSSRINFLNNNGDFDLLNKLGPTFSSSIVEYTVDQNSNKLFCYLKDYSLVSVELIDNVYKQVQILSVDKSHRFPKVIRNHLNGINEFYFIEIVEEKPSPSVSVKEILVKYIEDQNGIFQKFILTNELDEIKEFVIGDIDKDGIDDIMVCHTNDANGLNNVDKYDHISLLRNDKSVKTLSNRGSYNSNLNLIQDSVKGDYLTYLSFGGDFIGYITDINKVTPIFHSITSYCDADNVSFILVDLNNDNQLDVLMARSNIFYSKIFNYFETQYNFNKFIDNQVGIDLAAFKVVTFWFTKDLDGDGIEEVVASSIDNNIYTFSYVNDTTMVAKLIFQNIAVENCFPFDMDNDGDLDIMMNGIGLTVNSNPNGVNHVSVFENKGGLAFERKILSSNVSAYHVELIDINEDGQIDFLSSENNYLYLYTNRGGLNFTREVFSQIMNFNYFKLFDLDDDKDLDIVALNKARNKVSIFLKNNTGYLEHKISDYKFSGRKDFKLFGPYDYDNDGDLDFITNEDQIYLLENKGNFIFEKKVLIDGLTKREYNAPSIIDVRDIDRDGDFDIIRITEEDDLFEINFNIANQSKISAQAFYDTNENGVFDQDEYYYNDVNISIGTSNSNFKLYKRDSSHDFYVDSGFYEIYFDTEYNKNWNLTTPESVSVNINEKTEKQVLFGLTPLSKFIEVMPDLTSTIVRCNTTAEFSASLFNSGTEIMNGTITCYIDERLRSKVFLEDYGTLSSEKVTWNVIDFKPGESMIRKFMVNVPGISDALPLNTRFDFKLVFEDEEAKYFKSLNYRKNLRCSYDPNDKLMSPERADSTFLKDEVLNYTIRFQNTGNDTAFQVVIRDTLQDGYEPNSFRLLNSSHRERLQFTIKDEKIVEFSFKDIVLPDSTSNFLQSQGFVSYSLKSKADLNYGEVVENTAFIYFDFNPPIVTNTRTNVLVDTLVSDVYTPLSNINIIKLQPNPVTSLLHIICDKKDMHYQILNSMGQIVIDGVLLNNKNEVDVIKLSQGIYFIKIGNEVKRFVKS